MYLDLQVLSLTLSIKFSLSLDGKTGLLAGLVAGTQG
jgi:hypothetical protein